VVLQKECDDDYALCDALRELDLVLVLRVQGRSGTSVGEPNGFDDVHGEPISAIVGVSWRERG
jgi:hypothetical protein